MSTPVTLGSRLSRTPRLVFSVWNLPVDVEIAGSPDLLSGARALIERLERLWDPTLRDSDLHRVYALAGTVVTVEPETVALIELAARVAWKRPDASAALHDVVIDHRRDRVGLPDVDLLDLRALVPVLAAALLVRYLAENGAVGSRVRIGDSLRSSGSFAAPANAA